MRAKCLVVACVYNTYTHKGGNYDHERNLFEEHVVSFEVIVFKKLWFTTSETIQKTILISYIKLTARLCVVALVTDCKETLKNSIKT